MPRMYDEDRQHENMRCLRCRWTEAEGVRCALCQCFGGARESTQSFTVKSNVRGFFLHNQTTNMEVTAPGPANRGFPGILHPRL